MAKIVILPLLKMSSGHHQVADVVKKELAEYGHEVKKIDLLSRSWQLLESSLTSAYQKALKIFPKGYETLYRLIAGPENYQKLNLTAGLGAIFIKSLQNIIRREQPDFIICTHGFPSSILDRLKESNKCSIPVANIYTDFFINNFWGCRNIEYHFVSFSGMKEELLKRNRGLNVIISGIPVARVYKEFEVALKETKQAKNILITGGSNGLGSLEFFVKRLNTKGVLNYYILCGNNRKLHRKIIAMNIKNIIPLTYIYCKQEMCQLYDAASLVIGKPGGVTISECLHRRSIYYVHQCLPGQERYNLQYLEETGLVLNGCNQKIKENHLIEIINDKQNDYQIQCNIENYLSSLNHQVGSYINEILKRKYSKNTAGGIGYHG